MRVVPGSFLLVAVLDGCVQGVCCVAHLLITQNLGGLYVTRRTVIAGYAKNNVPRRLVGSLQIAL